MADPLHAFDFLQQPAIEPEPPVIALVGGERFLKRQVMHHLFPQQSDDADCTSVSGATSDWRTCSDCLSTGSLFSTGTRRVLLTDADDFVTRNRDRLEQYVGAPFSTSVLLLDLASLPSNTKLYKAILKSGCIIMCRLPEIQRGRRKDVDTGRLTKWLESWAKSHHKIKLTREAARQLTDILGWELGLLDQELAKLALFVEVNGRIDVELVDRVVGGWRTQTTWQMLDAAAAGDAASAIEQLDHLLQAGEAPQALFGAVAWSFRRFAAATRIYEQMERSAGRASLSAALEQAGFRKWSGELQKAEQQLKQISRPRASQLYQWLLETDLSLKGSHSAPSRARLALEKLIFRLAKQARPAV